MRRGRGIALAATGVASAGVAALAVWFTVTYWSRRFPQEAGWTYRETLFFVAGWSSVVLAGGIGLWLWWRAPRNPSGRLLWIAGISLGLWFVGTYWPHRLGVQLYLAIYAMRPALAMALLGWPTGRPRPRIRTAIVVVTLACLALGMTVTVFSAGTPEDWPRDPLSRYDVAWVSITVSTVLGWLLIAAPAAAVMIALARQWRRLPVGARRLLTPITVTGLVVAGTDIVTTGLNSFGESLVFDERAGHLTVLGTVVLLQNYAQVGIAAVGVLLATRLRRRVVAATQRRLDIDLAGAAPIATPTAALQRMLGDPTARIVYRRPDGVWVDADSRETTIDNETRSITSVVDDAGEVLAAVDCDPGRRGHALLVDAAVATVATRLANERAAALAKAREGELVAVQHALLDATDAARRQLERDLHDGAQQRLVGLAIHAKLALREQDSSMAEALRAEVTLAERDLLDLIELDTPPALHRGLAAALHTLAATCAVPMEVNTDGDLDGSDQQAKVLWLLACDATANTVKHARAGSVRASLRVDALTAVLRISDDGCGGVASVPASIARRVHDVDGAVTMKSPPGGGTDLVVTVRREAVRRAS